LLQKDVTAKGDAAKTTQTKQMDAAFGKADQMPSPAAKAISESKKIKK
jgi:hypothetical protein